MIDWMIENSANLVVGGTLFAILAGIIVSSFRKKKQGFSCGCGCSGCGMAGICHNDEKKE